jgi:SAM-dependent methyltransferase
MDARYYVEYFALEREHWWFRARRNILAAQVAKLTAGTGGRARILNVGAALGASTDMLSSYGRVVSLEYEKDCCEFVARKFGSTFVNASITELPFPAESFDLVCAFDVIEHVADDLLAVRELMRVCKPGGAVAVTVPAFMLLWSHHDVVNHHHRRYRVRQLMRLFGSSGRVVYASYFNSLLFPIIVAVRVAAKALPGRWIRRGAGSDFTLVSNSAVDAFCYRILDTENIWLRRGWRVPFGVSAFLAWRRA